MGGERMRHSITMIRSITMIHSITMIRSITMMKSSLVTALAAGLLPAFVCCELIDKIEKVNVG
jgi:hypothetical protein